MNNQFDRLIFLLIVITLPLSSIIGCHASNANSVPRTVAQGNPTNSIKPTTFKCLEEISGWVTVAEQGAQTSSPMITWNSKEFGQDYPPETRCRMVSHRLTKAVANNGGRLSNLSLTSGSVNKYAVICAIDITASQQECDGQNMLFNLSSSNAKKPAEALAKITNFGKPGGSPIHEKYVYPESIPLETLVNKAFQKP